MAISKDKKVEIVSTLKKKIEGAESIVFVNFHGLSVALATDLRKKLKSEGTGMMVAKKTLIRRAFAEGKVTGEMPELPGEVAVAYGGDQIAPARGIYEFEKANKDLVKILGGVFEGKYMDAGMMVEIASIPGREVLLGKLVNILNSPIQRFVMALDQISKLKANS
jgi:large subunit ribosomal protein L10